VTFSIIRIYAAAITKESGGIYAAEVFDPLQ